MGDHEDLLELLCSDDWIVVRNALSRLELRLRNRLAGDQQVDRLSAILVSLAEHPKWEVRKALADASLHFPRKTSDRTLAKLLLDDNSFVQGAAKRISARRHEHTTTDLLSNQHGDMMREWLVDLEAAHGPKARDAAMRVAQRFTGVAMQEIHHELVKVISPLDSSLRRLMAEFEAKEADKEARKMRLRRAIDRTVLLSEMVDSLREFYQDVTPRFESESLLSIIEEACALAQDFLAGAAPELRISAPPGLRIEVHRPRLIQAIVNVVKNGIEAYEGLERRAEIDLSVELTRPDQVQILCADGGCGMSKGACDDAFELFGSTKPRGTGFGLALAKKIVESEHGGTISLTSTKGVGTMVRIEIPTRQGSDGG